MNEPPVHYFKPEEGPYERQRILHEALGQTRSFEVASGTFGQRGFDFGSKLLLETAVTYLRANAPELQQPKLLDLGTGNGVLGLFFKAFFPKAKLWLVDVNRRAVETARVNAEHLYPEEKWEDRSAEAMLSKEIKIFLQDGLKREGQEGVCFGTSCAKSPLFDLAFMNPPIRAGNKVVYRLYQELQEALLPEGLFFFVVRKKQGAESHRKEVLKYFETVELLKRKKGYHVYLAKGVLHD